MNEVTTGGDCGDRGCCAARGCCNWRPDADPLDCCMGSACHPDLEPDHLIRLISPAEICWSGRAGTWRDAQLFSLPPLGCE